MTYSTGKQIIITLLDKTKSDKILVTSKDFGHFCPIILSILKFQNMIRFRFYGIQTVFFLGKNSRMSHR